MAREIQAALPGAELEILRSASHLSNMEQPARVQPRPAALSRQGGGARRAVAGDVREPSRRPRGAADRAGRARADLRGAGTHADGARAGRARSRRSRAVIPAIRSDRSCRMRSTPPGGRSSSSARSRCTRKNLEADARASLFVTESSAAEDPLAVGRVTLMGSAGARAAGRRRRRPGGVPRMASQRRELGGLRGLLVLAARRCEDVYWVGGFGAMDWLAVRDYSAAQPDPLDRCGGRHHRAHEPRSPRRARDLRACAGARGGGGGQDGERGPARLQAAPRTGAGLRSCRIAFPREVTTAPLCRQVLIEMLRECKSRG